MLKTVINADVEPIQSYTFITNDPAELIHIFHPFTQVALWRRSVNTVIETYLHHGLANNLFGSGFRTITHSPSALALDLFPDLPGREVLLEDVRLIAEIYTDLLGCDEIALRFEVLDGVMCPRFHVDRTGIRLVCTYRGAGTEWINDELVDRGKLGPGYLGLPDKASGLFDERTAIESAGLFDLVLFKGSLWQGNSHRGSIHRSPAVATAERRVLLVMDAVWSQA
ncbi:MAG: DUF1826 domain-containing protein [Nitrosospira sp.]|nr:DUF1826 domain-containing protein [Nitrosospira sp.]